MKKLICLFFAFLMFSLSLAQTKDNAGEVLYVYKGVNVYSNGDSTGKGGGQSPDYQCVAFIKRFYAANYKIALGSVGSASNAFAVWGKNPEFTAVPNGSSRKPQEDDILCFGGGTDGHVAIIVSVSSNSVTIIDQNRARYKADVFKDYDMTVSDGKYTIQKAKLNIQGWLTTKPAVIPDPPSTPALVGLMMPGAQAEPTITASFQNLYNGNSGQEKFGLPWNNNGHGIYVHDWGGLKVQDFLRGMSWCQFVWNPTAWQTYVVWNKILTFWNANWGYRDYGPPTGHEESAVYIGDTVAPPGSTIVLQRFSLDGGATMKTIVWDGLLSSPAKHSPVGTIPIDVQIGYHVEIINKSTLKKIVLPTATSNERQQYVVDSGLYTLYYYNQNGVLTDDEDMPVSEGNHKYWQPNGTTPDPGSGGSSGGGSSGGSSGGGSSGGSNSGGSGGGSSGGGSDSGQPNFPDEVDGSKPHLNTLPITLTTSNFVAREGLQGNERGIKIGHDGQSAYTYVNQKFWFGEAMWLKVDMDLYAISEMADGVNPVWPEVQLVFGTLKGNPCSANFAVHSHSWQTYTVYIYIGTGGPAYLQLKLTEDSIFKRFHSVLVGDFTISRVEQPGSPTSPPANPPITEVNPKDFPMTFVRSQMLHGEPLEGNESGLKLTNSGQESRTIDPFWLPKDGIVKVEIEAKALRFIPDVAPQWPELSVWVSNAENSSAHNRLSWTLPVTSKEWATFTGYCQTQSRGSSHLWVDLTSGTRAIMGHTVYINKITLSYVDQIPSSNTNPTPEPETPLVVVNHNPEFSSFSVSPVSGDASLFVNFSATIQDPDSDPVTVLWDFGDGSTSTQLTANHTYNTPGKYTVKATASDGKGGSIVYDREIIVATPKPAEPDPVTQPPVIPNPEPSDPVVKAGKLCAYYGDTLKYKATLHNGFFMLENAGTTTLNWEIKGLPDWVTCSETNGALGPQAQIQITAHLNYNQAVLGENKTTIRVTSNGGECNIPVYFYRSDAIFYFPSTGFNFAEDVDEISFDLENRGNATMTWSSHVNYNYLTISPSSGVIPGYSKVSLKFTVNRTGLTEKLYQTNVVLMSDGGGTGFPVNVYCPATPSDPLVPPPVTPPNPTPPEPVPVIPPTLEPAKIWVSLGSMTLTGETAGRVNVGNLGGSDLSWSLSNLPGWLAIDRTSGTIKSAGIQEINMEARPAQVTAGSAPAKVVFNSNGGSHELTINYQKPEPKPSGPDPVVPDPKPVDPVPVVPPPIVPSDPDPATPPPLKIAQLLVHVSGLGFVSPSNIQWFELGNSGQADLVWAIAGMPKWFACDKVSGTILAGGKDKVTLTADYSLAEVGANTATLKISSNGGEHSLSVTLDKPASVISPPTKPPDQTKIPILWTSLDACGFETMATRTFLIINTGTGTLTWNITDDSEWLACSPITGSGNAEITVAVDYAKATVGLDSGRITIKSNGGDKAILITLTKKETPQPAELTRYFLWSGSYGAGGPGRNPCNILCTFFDLPKAEGIFVAVVAPADICWHLLANNQATITYYAVNYETLQPIYF